MTLYLKESRARTLFKDTLGQANHFIITILVGLDAIETRLVLEAPAELHAVWSPKDATASSRRSRQMVLDMALVRAVDALDTYIRRTNRKPFLIQNLDIRARLDGVKHSVYERFQIIDESYPKLDKRLCALIELMIAWRNRRVHSEADNTISQEKWQLLERSAAWISEEFRDLNTDRLLKDFDKANLPAFREIASLINACNKYVEMLERTLFALLDKEEFLREIIWVSLSKNAQAQKNINSLRKARIQSIWGKDASERTMFVRRHLINNGLSERKSFDTASIFDNELINRIGDMTPSEVYAWCRPFEDTGSPGSDKS